MTAGNQSEVHPFSCSSQGFIFQLQWDYRDKNQILTCREKCISKEFQGIFEGASTEGSTSLQLWTPLQVWRGFHPCLYSQVFPRGIRRAYVAPCLPGPFHTLPWITSVPWWNGIGGRQKGSHPKHISHWNMPYDVCCKPHDISKQSPEHRNTKWNYFCFLSISTPMPEQNY